jgi:hypothetical protein
MTKKHFATVVALSAVLHFTAAAQGTFRNLDFEQARIVPIPGDPNGYVSWAAAMPGWTGYFGTDQVDRLFYNGLSLCCASMTIYSNAFGGSSSGQGTYIVQLKSGPDLSGTGQWIVPIIAQTGTIPLSAQSIQLVTGDKYSAGVGVFFNGQPVPLSQIRQSGTYHYVWGGNVSMFAGQTGELRFRGAATFLDDIQFSTDPLVPEPSVFALTVLGVVGVGCRYLRRKRL